MTSPARVISSEGVAATHDGRVGTSSFAATGGGQLVDRLRLRFRRGARLVSSAIYAGSNVYCPCCGKRHRKFLATRANTNHVCPSCGSFERQRLLILYLDRQLSIFERKLRVLHFAPEPCLYDRLKAAPGLDYVTADLENMPLVDIRLDITEMACPDEAFDLILCSHVLEHVEDDGRALREMRRVIRRGGCVVLQHPIDPDRDRTLEDPAITDPGQRLHAFGQADHVRRYGWDFGERVQAAGFEVTRVPLVDWLPDETVDRLVLRDGSSIRADDLYVCTPR